MRLTGRRHGTCASVALAVLVGTSAAAQTNDASFRDWTWTADAGTLRASGLGDAGVALADDLSALEINPATLASLERTELSAGIMHRGSGHTSSGDRILGRTSVSHVAVGARLGSRWSIGLLAREPQGTRIDVVRQTEALGRSETGRLDAVTAEAGGALALRVSDRLRVGARVVVARLALESEYAFAEEGAGEWRLVGSGGRPALLLASVGAHFVPGRRLGLGLAFMQGGSWDLSRTDVSPLLGLNLDGGSRISVERPSVLTGGLAWRVSRRCLLVGQVDRLGYGPLAAVPPNDASPPAFSRTAWRERLGIEVAQPFSGLAVQVRLGAILSLQAPSWLPGEHGSTSERADAERDGTAGANASLVYDGLRAAAGSWVTPNEEPMDPRDEPAAATAGASLVMASGLRLDVAVRASSRRIVASLGAAVRF